MAQTVLRLGASQRCRIVFKKFAARIGVATKWKSGNVRLWFL
jgi:hypothetical protein